jgi:hypothetical protein
MEGSNNPDALELTVGELKTNRCKQRFRIFSDYKEGFGSRFDEQLRFVSEKSKPLSNTDYLKNFRRRTHE